jgi:hypothetical protein
MYAEMIIGLNPDIFQICSFKCVTEYFIIINNVAAAAAFVVVNSPSWGELYASEKTSGFTSSPHF